MKGKNKEEKEKKELAQWIIQNEGKEAEKAWQKKQQEENESKAGKRCREIDTKLRECHNYIKNKNKINN